MSTNEASDLFNANKKKKFINAVTNRMPPFDRFVAKADIYEDEAILLSRKKNLERVIELLNKAPHSLIIPVIGSVGSGKTHYLWGIKTSFNLNLFPSFLSLPRSKEKFYYYLYSDFIKEFGINNLRKFTQEFGEKFGAAERLYGLFRTRNNEKILMNAISQLKNQFGFKNEFEQCVSVIISHLMTPEKFVIAERWLLGELMNVEDLFNINVNVDLLGNNMAETMLKILIENYADGIVYLFDDFGKGIREYQDLENLTSKDTNWANDVCETSAQKSGQLQSQEGTTCQQDLNQDSLESKIFNLVNNIDRFKIVITMETSESAKILEWYRKRFSEMSMILAEPIHLDEISLEDTFLIYFSRIKKFCIENNVFHPCAESGFKPDNPKSMENHIKYYGEDLYYPLTKEIIENVHKSSVGNPRSVLRNFKRLFDAIIFEETTVENLLVNYAKYIKSD